MNNVFHTLKENIPFLEFANSIEKIEKGYSQDEKYIIFCGNKKYLMRIGDKEYFEKKKTEFQVLKKIRNYGVQSPKPYDIALLNDLNSCYTIYSYIDGVDAIEELPSFTEKEQYEIGFEAGEQLMNMHLLEAPQTIMPWYERAMAKHYRYVDAYKSCGIKVNNDDKILEFIEKNKQLLKVRPNQFQHDDFHLGNIIVNSKKYAGVIDFDNFDWGDPIHDFVKVALFQRERSIRFSIGQIKGYFNEKVPEDFWRLYSIYSAMVVFSSVVWSLRFSPGQVCEMMDRIYNILDDHKNFELLKPGWYQ